MRFILMFFLLPVLLFSQPSKYSKYGFKDIKFGMPMDTVYSKLSKKYSVDKYGSYIMINAFNLPELAQIKVYFYGNANNRFFKFAIDGHTYSASYLELNVQEELDYLTSVFEQKFGKPLNKEKPSILNLKPGYITYYARWRHPEITIRTGIVSTTDFTYYAEAFIFDDKLEKEKKILENKKKNESIKKGADDIFGDN